MPDMAPFTLRNAVHRAQGGHSLRHAKTPAEHHSAPPVKAKVEKVMGEYKAGKLKSSSGSKVSARKQAVAIALSEGRRAAK